MQNLYIILAIVFAISLKAQTPELIVDFNSGPGDGLSSSVDWAPLDDAIVLSVITEGSGEEPGILRNGEITLLQDLYEGPEGSNPRLFTFYKDRVYFSAKSEENGNSLWVTDGTPEGTQIFHNPDNTNGKSIRAIEISENEVMYYNYHTDLYKTDGQDFSKIKEDVILNTYGNYPDPPYCLFNGDLAFLTESLYGVELYIMENEEPKLLTTINDVSSSVKFFGLTKFNNTLIFGIDDAFKAETSGTYRFDTETQALDKIAIGFENKTPLRLFSPLNNVVVGAFRDFGYTTIEESNDILEPLEYRSQFGLVSGEPIEFAGTNQKFVFTDIGDTFEKSHLIYSDGTSDNTIELTEISKYTSNMVLGGQFAYIASGTSNLFDPILYKIDIETGELIELFSFDLSSSSTNSILLYGVIDGKLYFSNSLDAETGREMYSLQVESQSSSTKNTDDTQLIELVITPTGFTIVSEENTAAEMKMFTVSGALLKSFTARTNVNYSAKELSGLIVLHFEVNGKLYSKLAYFK